MLPAESFALALKKYKPLARLVKLINKGLIEDMLVEFISPLVELYKYTLIACRFVSLAVTFTTILFLVFINEPDVSVGDVKFIVG